MLEGDPISYEDLVDKPVLLQGPPGIAADAPNYLPPTALSSELEHGYHYVSNNIPDAGYEIFGLSGDSSGVLFTNPLVWPLTISPNVPKSALTKYQIAVGFPLQARQKTGRLDFMIKKTSR